MPQGRIRWIVRPRAILTTPRILRDALGARRCVAHPDNRGRKFSLQNDFFLTYPPIEELEEYAQTKSNASGTRTEPESITSTLCRLESYRSIREFAAATKPGQRSTLQSSCVPTPSTATTHTEASALTAGKFVVRPLRHSQGRDYRITDQPTDFKEQAEYISCLFPKRHEYRIIFVRGTPLITLIKKVPDGIDPDGPWNHANGSTFITVNDMNNNRLRDTDVYDVLKSVPIIKSADLVAADVLLGKKKDGYVVTELNFCPALTIENNMDLVKQHVLEASRPLARLCEPEDVR